MKPKVYIETSVVSYQTASPSRDLIVAGHQQITHEWWETIRPSVECVVSPFVLQEAAQGDPIAAEKRLQELTNFNVLELNNEIKQLAQKYIKVINISKKSEIDALHLAFAVWYKVDYLLTWNCTHIAGGRVKKILKTTNSKLKIYTPVICTPEELMEV